MGIYLFPNETAPQRHLAFAKGEGVGGNLIPVVIVCTAYQALGDEAVHFTARGYTLIMNPPRNGRNCCVIWASDQDIRADELAVQIEGLVPGIAN
jgi:hypothetical protein